jgi:hypothetical protein
VTVELLRPARAARRGGRRAHWVRGKEKDTRTHQIRRIALDTETAVLLKEHRERVKARLEALDRPFTDDLFVFSGSKTPDHSEPHSWAKRLP